MSDTLIQSFEDGHAILKDRRQWIVKHPQTCLHARRGNLPSQYAKYTYLTSEADLQIELGKCHLTFQQAHPTQSPRLADRGIAPE